MAGEIDGETTLVLVSAIFVLFMTIPGLALFYGSLVSRKNLFDTMLQSVILTGTIPILWWMVGYSLCFDTSQHPLVHYVGGFGKALLEWGEDSTAAGITESAFCVFQLTFGIITAAIATGAVAERALLWPTMLIANLWFLLVYCPVCHMVWGENGLLLRWGVLDTAGGLVVETCSGVTALVLCYFVGPRSHPSDDPDTHRGVLHIMGAAFLWVGWLAFNGGSAYTSGARASTTVLNTLLAGSAGGLGWLACAAMSSCHRHGMLHLTATFHLMGGAVGGLCAATPSSGYVTPSGSLLVGMGAGVLCYYADHKFMSRCLVPRGIDDVVSVFPVHGVGGLWGTLATGLLAVERVGGVKGAIQGNWKQVGIQAASMLVVCLWTTVGTTLITFFVSRITKLRASHQEELTGLDTRPHGQQGLKKLSKRMLNQGGCVDEASSEDENDTSMVDDESVEEDSTNAMT
eukprot:CAMPEP_0115494808 /NCGR_PEP_ID=MMETSP0271-20121206/64916_1 /TAXON_ID=71861 /ORGANISM="Scrippsiella trochoidea, Strain CCMP3099" /LENGTH=458 /DNA_ID=CAMNT_0002923409 /DNA_START=47 /DNA_END=1423 /DNA_ORIENTATION=+